MQFWEIGELNGRVCCCGGNGKIKRALFVRVRKVLVPHISQQSIETELKWRRSGCKIRASLAASTLWIEAAVCGNVNALNIALILVKVKIERSRQLSSRESQFIDVVCIRSKVQRKRVIGLVCIWPLSALRT